VQLHVKPEFPKRKVRCNETGQIVEERIIASPSHAEET